tara:strand:- start:360 stop:647 length:288 start_codon:yes stop_codon:yes gene_type:complete
MEYDNENPLYVSLEFVAAVTKLYPDAVSPYVRDIVFYDSGDGKGPRLVHWAIDAPIPTDAEVEAALLIPEKVDNIAGLKADIADLVARLAALEAK